MTKNFKLRISRVIPSFHSCRSKDPCTLPSEPVPSLLRLSPINSKINGCDSPATPPLPAPQRPSKSHHSSLKRHVSSAITSVGCGFRSRSAGQCLSDDRRGESLEFQWQKEERWHVVAKVYDETPRRKIYNSSISGVLDDDVVPPPPPPKAENKIKRKSKKTKRTPRLRTSTSSAESGLFSSEGVDDQEYNEETETLVSSSRSFSTDSSSEFTPHLETIREAPMNCARRKKRNAKMVKRSAKRAAGRAKAKKRGSSPESESPARLSMFQRLIPCTVDGKVRESFAVVKKSEDPYEDFKRSMMEMILEKQMFEPNDLEQLLHCFLSLNSRHHHAVIVEAFSEIWEALFSRTSIDYRRVPGAL